MCTLFKNVKILLAVLIISILFVSCGDSDYINTVKSLTFENGISVEEIVDKNIKSGEVYIENNNVSLEVIPVWTFAFLSNNEISSLLSDIKFILPKNFGKIEWEIEGSTKNGKIVKASNGRIEVKITTTQNGDYIQLYENDIKTYTKSNNKLLSTSDITHSYNLYKSAIKSGYGETKKELETTSIKRFDENFILKNKSNYDIKYYSSGRVSFISDDYTEVSLKDGSNIEEIKEDLIWLKQNIKNKEYADENINILVDFTYNIEYKIIAEKLNKKLSSQDKEKIMILEKDALKLFNVLQKEVNKINQ